MTRLNLDLNSELPVIYLFLSSACFPTVLSAPTQVPTAGFAMISMDLSVNSQIQNAIAHVSGKKTHAKDKKPAVVNGGVRTIWQQADWAKQVRKMRNSLLPRTLLVPMRLQALTALVLVHLQTTFLFEIAHK